MKKYWGFLAVGYATFVIGFGFATIGLPKEPRKEGERYGWEMPFSAASLVLPMLFFAYQWGKSKCP